MEEKKTAAIVLSILALVAIFFFGVLPYIDKKSTHILAYSNCKIKFKYRYDVDALDDFYIIAQNDLGLCLFGSYLKKHNDTVAKKIIDIYKKYGHSICPDTINEVRYRNLDSILKYKIKAFRYMLDD